MNSLCLLVRLRLRLRFRRGRIPIRRGGGGGVILYPTLHSEFREAMKLNPRCLPSACSGPTLG